MTEQPGAFAQGLPLTRRRALGLLAGSAGALLTGCGAATSRAQGPREAGASGSTPTASRATTAPERDLGLMSTALLDERGLLAWCVAAERAFPQDAELLYPLADQQAVHVSRIAATIVTPGRRVRVGPPALPGTVRLLHEQLGSRTAQSAVARRADCLAASAGALATLFCSLSAAHAVSAASMTKQVLPAVAVPEATSAAEALQRCLAAEHAAVYAYGLLGGVLRAGVSDSPAAGLAAAGYDAHRSRRDGLIALIASAGLAPVATLPAYDITPAVTGPRTAAALAVRIESRCAQVYASTTASVTGPTRAFTCDTVTDCASRRGGWGAPPSAFPGL